MSPNSRPDPPERRSLGEQGLTTSAIGLGCMGLSVFYGTDTAGADPDRLVGEALDLGIDLIDTSDAYGPHTNEVVVGNAIRYRRDEVVLSTKFGIVRDAETADGVAPNGLCGRPAYVRLACEASLQRLGTDRIDLYIQHRLDPDTPVEETVGAMGELVEEGKVRFIALCEVSPETIRRAHATYPLSAVHTEYSLWSRDPEQAVLPTLTELGIGFLPYSPLGRGFLTGRIRSLDDLAEDDWRRHSPRFQGANFQANLDLLDRVQQIADKRGVTPAQLALAWVLAQGDSVVPLQGATRVTELRENAAATACRLTDDDLRLIDEAAPLGAAAGDAWPDGSAGSLIDR